MTSTCEMRSSKLILPNQAKKLEYLDLQSPAIFLSITQLKENNTIYQECIYSFYQYFKLLSPYIWTNVSAIVSAEISYA